MNMGVGLVPGEQYVPQETQGANIINQANAVGLDAGLLYEAVVDLSASGMLTANCINLAAGILLKDLGLPGYFFNNIQKESLIQLLQAIASSIRVIDGKAELFGRVAHIDFDHSYGRGQRVRIATAETRDSMDSVLEELLIGHRREYYYSPENEYYTYIIHAETVKDFAKDDFKDSPFLFNLVGDYNESPEPTRKRYETFLKAEEKSPLPTIQVFNLPETGETRLMFKSDFLSPQLPILRKVAADRGFIISRAYWEPYLCETEIPSSVCSLYLQGELTRREEEILVRDLENFLAFSQGPITSLYLDGSLTFDEMLFGGNAVDFTHLFIFKESENASDKAILEHLTEADQRDAFAKRTHDSNRSTYRAALINEAVKRNPDLISELYALFARRFDPQCTKRLSDEQLEVAGSSFDRKIQSRFMDFPLGYDIFRFMFKIVSCTLKTNFFRRNKRSFSFRFDERILDPLVYSQNVYGIFFVNGHYSRGTHMRAADVARGGLRLVRVSSSNHERELDGAVLLNYALGPKGQHLKHKDICEGGSKGVVVPHPLYAENGKDALADYTEGIMDLILVEKEVIVDYYGRPEMIFFGPDEGTAPLMDDVAHRAGERGYEFWRTLTTGKSFGIPHDTYGLLESGECFGLFDRGASGVELQVDGKSVTTTNDMEEIFTRIGDGIAISGMTTASVMSAFRTMIDHYGVREEDLNLMITGGPDGDLGANQIQCYKGRICLVIDGGSVLFDPEGLDKKELRKIAFSRNGKPRKNSLDYPADKLSPRGFKVPIQASNITLPDGTVIEDGALFHRNFLTGGAIRELIAEADIRTFIPCGGFKDTINQSNVASFVDLFKELEFIVEGANIFFDDGARRYIAQETCIKQIKDSTANKGGVFSSSLAEVLTAFVLGEDYEEKLLVDEGTRWGLVRDVISMVERNAREETTVLLDQYENDPKNPLFDLSVRSSKEIYELQDKIATHFESHTIDEGLIKSVLESYTPSILIEKLGIAMIVETLSSPNLIAYRNAIITKKLSATAYYKFGAQWNNFLNKFEQDPGKTLLSITADTL